VLTRVSGRLPDRMRLLGVLGRLEHKRQSSGICAVKVIVHGQKIHA